jgi:hypothetical protein
MDGLQWLQVKKRYFAASLLALVAGGVTAQAPARAQNWQAIPLRNATIKGAGLSGGEGCQWPQGLAIDGTGNFLLFGTDVGGIFRSLDGGNNWEPCNVGYAPRGNAGFAIDPNNSSRALAVGANSATTDFHGLYLTTNQAASWSKVVGLTYSGYRDVRDQVAYDKSVVESGYSKYAYWSAPDGKLYWSQNGGTTWGVRNNGYGNAFIKVNPGNGYVYAGNGTAFYRSTNRASSFTQRLAGAVQGLDATGNSVWVSKQGGVWRSTDSGWNFTKLTGTGLPTTVPLRNVRVHPANANYLLVVGDHGDYDKRIYYSSNGGSSWAQGSYNNANAFIPYNNRLQLFAWHPTNTAVAHSFGGDWITKTTNGGGTWNWNANGYTGVLGGRFNFTNHATSLVMISIQDYNGAWTNNAGDTWTYENISGNGWGGFCYGGGMMWYADNNETVWWSGNAGSWGGARTLKIKRSGWSTWANADDANGNDVTWGSGVNNGQDVSLVDPDWWWVSFIANWRTEDRGWHWSPMSGCDGVFTFSQSSRHLFGVKYNGGAVSVVKSSDHGVTWQTYGASFASGGVADVAVGVRPGGGERVYAVHDDVLKYWDTGVSSAWTTVDSGLTRDQWGWHRIKTVATDPQNLSVVYVGSSRDVYATVAAVQRSTNCAEPGSWTNLTRSTPLAGGAKDGGREAIHIRVHPTTREAWVVTSCYGIWKIGPP